MEEATRFAIRDRRSSEALTVLPPPAISFEAPREPHLLDYFIILRKHQWLILAFALTVVTVVTIATMKMKPVYEATARVEVDRGGHNVLPFEASDSYEQYMDSEDYIETQTKILQSETLALQTIKSLDLEQYPEFGGGGDSNFSQASAQVKRPAILGAFLGSLTVKRVPNTNLIEVGFTAQDPELAAKIVNAHVDNFREADFRSTQDATLQASTWLSQELEELRVKMQNAEDARVAYERNNQIWVLGEKGQQQDITAEKLSDLSKTVTTAETELAQKAALYTMATSGEIDATPVALSNPVIQGLIKQKSDLETQYNTLLAQYGPNWPKVQQIAEQQKQVQKQLDDAHQIVTESAEEDYNGAKDRLSLLEANLDSQKAEANVEAEKLVEYGILDNDATSTKQLYDGLLEKLKEAQIQAGLSSSNIRFVDKALSPTSPAGPQRTRNILLGLLVGVVGGIGLAIFREYLDNTVKSPDDIERLTGLPSLAVVPNMPNMNAPAGKMARLSGDAAMSSSGSRVELLAYVQPKSQISEAFRALRTSLLLSQAEHPPQVILVTSSLPREGKTTAAVNLAVTLAQLGDRTLIIDCDLRKPGVRRALNLTGSRDAGLSSYLAGVCSLDEVTMPHPTISNLSALTTGPVPPSPADLLSSHRMRDGITELRRRFKFIVVDSPPIMAATDAVIISALTDGVLLVVRSGATPKEAFTRTRDLLSAVKSRFLGVILNGVDSSAPDYYYSYRYYPYAYGYGYGEDVNRAAPIPMGSDKDANPST
jgi:succinoglycan biosynthesis transport protein ExoP